jgi:hypothetical protein
MVNGAYNHIILYLLGMTGIWKAVPVGIAIKTHSLDFHGLPVEHNFFTAVRNFNLTVLDPTPKFPSNDFCDVFDPDFRNGVAAVFHEERAA